MMDVPHGSWVRAFRDARRRLARGKLPKKVSVGPFSRARSALSPLPFACFTQTRLALWDRLASFFFGVFPSATEYLTTHTSKKIRVHQWSLSKAQVRPTNGLKFKTGCVSRPSFIL
jgi:hypothetical protein